MGDGARVGREDPSKLTEVEDRPRWLGERYVEGNNAYEDNPEAQAEIKEYNRRIYEIQATGDHESPLAQIYWTCRQWSYDYFAGAVPPVASKSRLTDLSQRARSRRWV